MNRLLKIIAPVAMSLSVGLAATAFFVYPHYAKSEKTALEVTENKTETTSSKKIKIALLLDTSNSMDGLINQAKSQLWSLVNELSTASCEGEKPELQLALYQYGNQGLSSSNGYIQQVSPFTGELDDISSKLFGLNTNGGDEFCGQVIQKSLNELTWGSNSSDLKFIFIAGNEDFDQGSVNYLQSCLNAREKDIVVNTIFCGDFEEGIRTNWKNGAVVAKGDYMSIDHNQKTVYLATPYDTEIEELNTKLNQTYIHYGTNGKNKYRKQTTEDQNAESISYENKVNRTVSKGSSFYSNSNWDLVDKTAGNEEELEEVLDSVDTSTLPTEMQSMDTKEKIKYVQQKSEDRTKIQTQIQELNTKRKVYITQNSKEKETNLNTEMMKAIKKKAEMKKYTFSN